MTLAEILTERGSGAIVALDDKSKPNASEGVYMIQCYGPKAVRLWTVVFCDNRWQMADVDPKIVKSSKSAFIIK